MQHVFTPKAKKLEQILWWDNAFSDDELNWLQDKAKAAKTRAEVGADSNNQVNENIRKSEINWLAMTEDSYWVFERLENVACSLNAEYYNFNLTGFGENIQLTNYGSHNQGMYCWHQDFGSNVSRKLSIVMQLSDPKDYEGGELQVLISGKPESVNKKRGFISVFPSWVLHQVTPVTRGTRQSLVAWVSGSPFK